MMYDVCKVKHVMMMRMEKHEEGTCHVRKSYHMYHTKESMDSSAPGPRQLHC